MFAHENKIIFILIALAFLLPLSFATTPIQTINEFNLGLYGIILILLAFMLVLAGIAYIFGPIMGADFSAKMKVWAGNIVASTFVIAGILVLMAYIFPNFLGVSTSLNSYFGLNNLPGLIGYLFEGLRVVLIGSIFLLVIFSAIIYLLGNSFGADVRARGMSYANLCLGAAIVLTLVYTLTYDFIFGGLSTSFFNSIGVGPYFSVLRSVILGVSAYVGIVYAASKFLRVPEWEAYFSAETSQLFGAIVMAIFAVGLIGIANSFVSSFDSSVTSSITPNQALVVYLNNGVGRSVNNALTDVYTLQTCTSLLNTLGKRMGEAALSQTYKVFPGIDTFVSITNVLGFGFVTIYGSITVQASLLYLFDVIVLNFLLPGGIILRFIPATRDAGAFLIAASIAFLIVYPTTFFINKAALSFVEPHSTYRSNSILVNSICGAKYGYYGYLLNAGVSPLRNIPVLGGSLATLGSLISEGYLNAISMQEFLPIMEYLGLASLTGLFMPSLSMLITISSINVITKFILTKT